MPALSPTMTSGVISEWKFKPGQPFNAGDSLAEVQTDKASIDFECTDGGVMGTQFVSDGAEVACGDPICITLEEDEEWDAAAFADFPVPSSGSGTATAPVVAGIITPTSDLPDSNKATVSAFFHAKSQNLDALSLFPGTGKGGRVTKGDVLTAMKSGSITTATTATATSSKSAPPSPSPSPSPSPTTATTTHTQPNPPPYDGNSTFTDEAPSQMRKVIASRLTESKRDTPHYYLDGSVRIDNLLQLRKEILNATGGKVSVNDVVVKCAGMALRDVGKVNHPSAGGGDSGGVDVSVAVATPAGLITPIVKNVEKIGLKAINSEIAELAGRAKLNKLKPEEFIGGTFTISNLGMFGISEFSAVINGPQGAILAVGGGIPTVVGSGSGSGSEGGEGVEVATMMSVRLSCDRNVFDEEVAGRWMQSFKAYTENPKSIIL
ncbi:hypothetical protein ScalyP_jg4381 [Parmales sp. scaly parma]|nr:hypothetical protein ScalyP_jg4381 [Parmales sp. scaly parma]